MIADETNQEGFYISTELFIIWNHMKKKIIVIISFCGICGLLIIIIFFFFFFPGMFIVLNVAEYPKHPDMIPYYISINETSISISGRIPDVTITEQNAQSIVRDYLIEQYVFPDDMIYRGTSKSYTSVVKNGGEVRKIFNGFDVNYGRVMNNLSVHPGDEINIRITEDGFIDLGHMLYRNYTELGSVEILNPQVAYEKLKVKEDIVAAPMQYHSIIVKEISLCYYFSDDHMLMPVWYFRADDGGYYVKGYDSYEYN